MANEDGSTDAFGGRFRGKSKSPDSSELNVVCNRAQNKLAKHEHRVHGPGEESKPRRTQESLSVIQKGIDRGESPDPEYHSFNLTGKEVSARKKI